MRLLYSLLLASATSAFSPASSSSFLRSVAPTRSSSPLFSSSDEGEYDYDFVVIGGGSGGVRASRIASGHGAKVLLLEGQLEHGAPNYSAIGGTCVNVGCVPKKLMVFASRYPDAVEESAGYGWEGATAGT